MYVCMYQSHNVFVSYGVVEKKLGLNLMYACVCMCISMYLCTYVGWTWESRHIFACVCVCELALIASSKAFESAVIINRHRSCLHISIHAYMYTLHAGKNVGPKIVQILTGPCSRIAAVRRLHACMHACIPTCAHFVQKQKSPKNAHAKSNTHIHKDTLTHT